MGGTGGDGGLVGARREEHRDSCAGVELALRAAVEGVAQVAELAHYLMWTLSAPLLRLRRAVKVRAASAFLGVEYSHKGTICMFSRAVAGLTRVLGQLPR